MELNFKYIIIGNSGSGKTSFINNLLTGNNNKKNNTTIGVEFSTKNIIINDDNIKLQIWDTAGQEQYFSMTQTYYRGSIGIIILFDLTDLKSFENLEKWYKRAYEINSDISSFLIIGNKNDLKNKRIVKIDEIKKLLNELNKEIIYYECNSVNGENINNSIEELTKIIYNKKEKIPKNLIYKNQKKFKINLNDKTNIEDNDKKICYNC